MNKKKRIELKDALLMIEKAYSKIECVKEDEAECLQNMPENLEKSEQCTKMEDVIDNLEDALSSIKEAQECIENSMS